MTSPPQLPMRLAVAATATAAMMTASAASSDRAPDQEGAWSVAVLILVGTWSFLVWRLPRLSVLAAPATVIVLFATVTPAFPLALAMAVPLYVVGRIGHPWWGATAITSATLVAGSYRLLVEQPGSPFAVALNLVQDDALLVLVLLLGDTVRTRALVKRDADLEREVREAEHQRRLTDERLTIARDLHDILAHTLTLVGVQAHVAAENLDRDRAVAARAVDRIRTACAEALADLRGTITLLRRGDVEPPTWPEAGLAQIPDLVQAAASTGIDVEYVVVGADDTVRPALGQAAYRIVQEALTNAARHGHASRATVRIEHGSRALQVEVRDNGTAEAPGLPGYGIQGMTERVVALGGRLHHGPGNEGCGFVVTATLPHSDGPG